jgi:predicted anti-sigma-YlaC factor YlaD
MICRKVKANLENLLLDPEAVPVEVRGHLDECGACRQELAALESTMSLMDEWQAPEPTPYFDSRLTARLREEQRAEPAGFFERMRSRLLFGSNVSFRPLAAGALALLLIIGGGTYAGLMTSHPAVPVQASATVQDLQSLDDNAQVFQQLTALDQNDQSDNDGSSPNNL